MSIFHLHVQSIGRGSGGVVGGKSSPNRSAVACAAYRAGCSLVEQVMDPDTGMLFDRVHDYTKKGGVEFSAIFAPENAASWMKTREQLWNRIQLDFDKRVNAVFAKEFDIALPRELDIEQNIELIKEFVSDVLVSQGLVVDVNFHNDNPENPHFHLMTSTREIVPVLDASGAASLEHTFGKKIRDIDSKSFLNHVRCSWAAYTNKHLERAGVLDRIDHRSYKDMGIDIVPTMHIGVGTHVKAAERAAINLEIISERSASLIQNPEMIISLVGIEKSCFKLSDIEDKAGKFLLDNLGGMNGDMSVNDGGFRSRDLKVGESNVESLDLGSEGKSRDNNSLNNDSKKSNVAAGEAVILDEYGAESLVKSKQEIMSHLLLSDNLVRLEGMSEIGDYYTTRERIESEEKFLDVAERLSKSCAGSGGVDEDRVNNKLSRSLTMSEEAFLSYPDPKTGLVKSVEQRSVVRGLIESGNLAQLYGYAGSGKSTVLTSVRDLYLARGVNVTGLAPTAKSRSVLTDLGIEALTIHGLKAKEEGVAKTLACIESGNIAGIESWKLSAARNYETPFRSDAVFMLDEASMVDLDMYSWILDRCNEGGSKLISIGDYNQLPVVKGIGGGFKALCSDSRFEGSTHTLSEIWRQEDKDYRDITVALANFKVSDALSILKEKRLDDLHFIEGGSESLEKSIARDYVSWYKEQNKLRDKVREGMLSTSLGSAKYEIGSMLGFTMDGGIVDGAKSGVIISYKRDAVNRLNNLVRQDLYLSGVLESSASRLIKNISLSSGIGVGAGIDLNEVGTKVLCDKFEISLLIGEQIMFLKNDKRAGLYNGEVATVLKIEESLASTNLGSQNDLRDPKEQKDQKSHDILVRIHGSDGKDRMQWFNSAKYGSFDYGYASTLHKVQGSSYENVFFHFDKQVGFESFYVGMTRHKANLNVYFDKDDLKSILYERYGVSTNQGIDNDKASRLSSIVGVGDTDKERDLNLSFAALESRVTRRSSELLISNLGNINDTKDIDKDIDKDIGDVSNQNTGIFAKYHQARNDYAVLYREISADIALNPKIGDIWNHPRWNEFKELKEARGCLAKIIASDPSSFEGELFITRANIAVIREHAGITKFGIERKFGDSDDISSKVSNYIKGDVRDQFKIDAPILQRYNDICDMQTNIMFGSSVAESKASSRSQSESNLLSGEEKSILLANLMSESRELYNSQKSISKQITALSERKVGLEASLKTILGDLESERTKLSNISDGIAKIYVSNPELVVKNFQEYLKDKGLNAKFVGNQINSKYTSHQVKELKLDKINLSKFGEVSGRSYNLGLFRVSGFDKRRNLEDRDFTVRSMLNYINTKDRISILESSLAKTTKEKVDFAKKYESKMNELGFLYIGDGAYNHLRILSEAENIESLSNIVGGKGASDMLERGYKMIRDKNDALNNEKVQESSGENLGEKANTSVDANTRKELWNDLSEMKSLLLSKLTPKDIGDYSRAVIGKSSHFSVKNIEISSGNLKAGSLSVALSGANSGKWYRFSKSKGGDIYGLASYLGVSEDKGSFDKLGISEKLNSREGKQIRAYIEFASVSDYFGLDIGSKLIASIKESGVSNLKNLNIAEIKNRISALAVSHVDIKSLDRSYISEYKDNWKSLSKIPSDAPRFDINKHAEFLLGRNEGNTRYEIYDYRDVSGNLLCHSVRVEEETTGDSNKLVKKGIYPISYAHNTETGEVDWRVKAPSISGSGGAKLVYGMEKLGSAEEYGVVYQGKPVLIVEGEKTSDRAQEILGDKYAVISWMGGSSAASKVDWSALSGREVVIWGDNDVAGVNAVNKISESIKENNIDVKSLNIIPVRQLGLDIGWDPADKLPDHLVSEEFDKGNVIKSIITNPEPYILKARNNIDNKIGAVGYGSQVMNNQTNSESDKISIVRNEAKANLQNLGVWNVEYESRLNHELGVIEKAGASEEFIRSANIIRYAKSHGIEVGEGRGSVVGSLAAFSLGIHNVDPIKHELSFDRFMSEGKTTVPDIDIDVSSKDREKLVDHVMSYYGDRAAIMITKTGARHPSSIMIMPVHMNIAKAESENWATFSVDKQTGYPLIYISEDVSHKDIEDAGFRKIDLLSSKMLDQNREVIDIVNMKIGSDIVPRDIIAAAMHDNATYRLIARGDTDGVFQLGGDGAKDICKRVEPKEFSDVVNILALNRPGARMWLPLFENSKDQKLVIHAPEVPHDPAGIFASTRGAVLYQEQIMEAGVKYFGIDAKDSDSFRRDFSKDSEDRALANKESCIDAATTSNASKDNTLTVMSEVQAEYLYKTLEKASSFVYNKSHATAYAKHTLTTAYLKDHYRDKFVQTHNLEESEKNKIINNENDDNKNIRDDAHQDKEIFQYVTLKTREEALPKMDELTGRYILNDNILKDEVRKSDLYKCAKSFVFEEHLAGKLDNINDNNMIKKIALSHIEGISRIQNSLESDLTEKNSKISEETGNKNYSETAGDKIDIYIRSELESKICAALGRYKPEELGGSKNNELYDQAEALYNSREEKIKNEFEHNALVKEFAKKAGDEAARYFACQLVDYRMTMNPNRENDFSNMLTERRIDIMKNVSYEQVLLDKGLDNHFQNMNIDSSHNVNQSMISGVNSANSSNPDCTSTSSSVASNGPGSGNAIKQMDVTNQSSQSDILTPDIIKEDINKTREWSQVKLCRDMTMYMQENAFSSIDVATAQRMRNENISESTRELEMLQISYKEERKEELQEQKQHQQTRNDGYGMDM